MSDKQLYSYADVIIDPADPRVEIGAEYYFGDNVGQLLHGARTGWETRVLRDVCKTTDEYSPFYNGSSGFSCIIRKKEPKKKHVPFDLSKPEVRDRLRGQWIRRKPYSFNPGYCLEVVIDCFEQVDEGAEGLDSIYWVVNGISALELLEDWTFLDGSPCGQEMSE